MDVKIAVENTVDDALTEHLALVSDTNAALLQELHQHVIFTESLPDPSLNVAITWFRNCMQIMLAALERLNVGEDWVKARELWSGLLESGSDTLGDSAYQLINRFQYSTIFILKSSLRPLADKELDKTLAFKVTPFLNAIEENSIKYLTKQDMKEENPNLYTLLHILHTHLDGMTLRMWQMYQHEVIVWKNMIITYLEDCVEVIQFNDTDKPHANCKIGTFIADGRVIEELPVSIEAQSLLRDTCEWWSSQLLEWYEYDYDEPYPKLVELHSTRENLSLLKLTEVYCAAQEYNEEWALALLL